MVVIRKSMISTLSCVFAVALMGAVDVAPVQAQQYAGTSNSRQSSIGDIDQKKLNAQIEKLPGLNFGTIGLFGDAEIFVYPVRLARSSTACLSMRTRGSASMVSAITSTSISSPTATG